MPTGRDRSCLVGLALGLCATLLVGCGIQCSEAAPPEADFVRWGQPVEIAAGQAQVGPWRMNDSVWRYVDDPTVAVDAEGRVAVAWVDQARRDVLLQVYEPDGDARFDAPTDVSRTPEVFSWLPRILLAEDGQRVHVLWQEIVFSGGSHGGEAFHARSTDGGRTFDAPSNLSQTTRGVGKGRMTGDRWHNGSLDLARGPEGTLYAAWTSYQGPLQVARSTDGGASFSEPVHVAGGREQPLRAPSLAVGPEGTVHLAWTPGTEPTADLQVARSTDRGRTFSEPRVVHATGGWSDAPSLGVDSQGTVHLVWDERPEGRSTPSHLGYASSEDGLAFSDPTAMGGPPLPAGFPALALDGRDHLYVVAELFPDADDRPRGLGLLRSTDGGKTFGPLRSVPAIAGSDLGSNGSLQGHLMRKLAAAGGGRIAVVNSTFDHPEASHVWLLRGRAGASR